MPTDVRARCPDARPGPPGRRHRGGRRTSHATLDGRGRQGGGRGPMGGGIAPPVDPDGGISARPRRVRALAQGERRRRPGGGRGRRVHPARTMGGPRRGNMRPGIRGQLRQAPPQRAGPAPRRVFYIVQWKYGIPREFH